MRISLSAKSLVHLIGFIYLALILLYILGVHYPLVVIPILFVASFYIVVVRYRR